MRSIATAVLLLSGRVLFAQAADTPRVGYVYPAGGRQGTTFDVTLGGQYLDGVRGVHVSGGGVRATVVDHVKPITQRELTRLRERLQQLRKEPEGGARDEVAAIREKMATFRRSTNPAIAERVTVTVTIAGGVDPADREIRLETSRGLTNPLVFRVGSLPEISEAAGDVEPTVTLPATLNGQIVPVADRPTRGPRPGAAFTPGDVDRYRFTGRRGEELVVVVSARELIPYLADAVPGWFQATVTLFDAEGRELAYEDDFRFRPDPVLHYRIPADGDYVVEIKDAIHRGREDFVYRVSIGALPFVTGLFPLGGRTGGRIRAEVSGWNLPDARLTVDAKRKAPGLHAVAVTAGAAVSNSVPFAVAAPPECLERESNDREAEAQRITLPIVVNGRIGTPGDVDVFRFEGRAGDILVAEVHARRLGSPLASVLTVSDSAGRVLAFNDDHDDKRSGLETHHADSRVDVTLPARGTYYVRVADVSQTGGPELAYRLRLGAPVPDFALRVVPSSINARAGTTVPLTVHALRQDGFDGDIALALADAPRGARLSGAVVPAGQESVRLTLTVPDEPRDEPARLRVVGRAVIGRREVEREAVPADDRMQAFAYRHLVPAQELLLAVTGAGRRRGPRPPTFAEEGTLKIPAGGTAFVRVTLPPMRTFPGVVRFELSDPPAGITLPEAVPVREVPDLPDGPVLVFRSDAAAVKPGQRGNLIVTVVGERTPEPGQPAVPANRRRVSLATLPALPFEVVDR